MPTGHTEPVITGMIDTAGEFAYECSKSFGWSMREGGRLKRPSTENMYQTKYLGELIAELAEWNALSEEGKYAQWSRYYAGCLSAGEANKRETAQARERLELVLAEVKAINVPESHANFKQFMIDQLTEAIRVDGTHNAEWYRPQEYVEYCDAQVSEKERMIARYTEIVAERGANIAKGREWVDTLANLYGLKVDE